MGYSHTIALHYRQKKTRLLFFFFTGATLTKVPTTRARRLPPPVPRESHALVYHSKPQTPLSPSSLIVASVKVISPQLNCISAFFFLFFLAKYDFFLPVSVVMVIENQSRYGFWRFLCTFLGIYWSNRRYRINYHKMTTEFFL